MAGSMATLLLFAIFMSSIITVEGAQSGRRVPKKNDSPAPVQGTAEEPPPSETSPKKSEPAKVPVLIARDSPSMRSSEYLANRAIEGVTERLKESSTLQVTRGRGMSRKEASDYARASKTDHVVWVELNYDTMMGNRVPSDSARISDLTVDYAVYAPETGKVAASGRVYGRPYRSSVGGVGLPLPGHQQIEYVIRQAGQDVADRVMNALKVAAPPRRL
jgi:hypothetical protein